MANDSELLAALKAAHDEAQAARARGDEAGAQQAEQNAIHIASLSASQPVTHEPIVLPPPPGSNTPGGPPKGPGYDPSEGPGTLQFGPWDTGIKTSQGVNRFLAGAGQSFADTGRGISQLFGGQTQADTDEQRRLDAPLEHTGAGILGNVAGGVAQFAVPGMGGEALGAKIAAKLGTSPGALQAAQAIYRITKPAATGAGYGAIAPVGTGETRGGNAGMGAVAGEVGGVLGDAGASVLRAGEDTLSRGARIGADIAKKYNIPLSMPQTSGGFAGWVGSALDKLPFSGAAARHEGQRDAFNSALGDISGIDTGGGPMDMESWQQGRKKVGANIGAMADGTMAFVTPNTIAGVNQILHDANTIGTDENAKIVNSWANRLFGPNSKAVPIQNPLPGGPVMQIPGDAWRQQNTALNDHIARTDNGDLVHYLTGLQGHYFDSLEHGMPPDKYDMFQDLRKQYSNAMTIRPLVEKAGTAGVNPNLVMNRALTEGNAFSPSGSLNDIGELGQLGKEQLTSKYPDSGTAQRALIYAGLAGAAGATGNELFGGKEGDSQHGDSALGGFGPMGAMVLGGLGSRVLHSRPVARYSQARLPEDLAKYVNLGASSMPGAAAAASSDATSPPEPVDSTPSPDQPMADGGQPDNTMHKSSFWDLVQQAWHEMSEPSTPQPAAPVNDGTQASGSKGADFDNWVNRNVDQQS
jgi:hypothetical protein